MTRSVLLRSALSFVLAAIVYSANAAQFSSPSTLNTTRGLPFSFTIKCNSVNPIMLDTSYEDAELPPGLTYTWGTGTATLSGAGTQCGAWTVHFTTQDCYQALYLTIANPNSNPNRPVINSFSIGPNPVSIGATVSFSVQATDADGDHLAYYWNFGDGHSSRAQNPTHIYSVEGTFNASVTVADASRIAGEPAKVIVAPVLPINSTLLVKRAKITFNFRNPLGSRVQLTGTVATPNVPLIGITPSWTMGGLARGGFGTFNAGGVVGDTKNLLKCKVRVGGTTQNTSDFTIDMKGDKLYADMDSIGFVNTTTGAVGTQVGVPLSITYAGNFAGSPFTQSTNFTVFYKAVQGKSGTGSKTK